MKRDLNGILRAYVRILPDIQLKRPPLPIISQNYIHTINFVLQYDLCLQRQKRSNQKYINDDEQQQATGCVQALVNLVKRKRTTSSTSSITSQETKSKRKMNDFILNSTVFCL
jgi:hypothetical protein